MAYLNVRVDDLLKKQAEAILAELGITLSASITIFLKRMVRYNGIPFELRAGPIDSVEDDAQLLAAKNLVEIDDGTASETDETDAEPASVADQRWQSVLAYLQVYHSICTVDVRFLLNISPATTSRLLHTWVEQGKLEQIRDGRAKVYRLPNE